MSKIGGALGWWALGIYMSGFPFGLMALAIWALGDPVTGFAVWAGMGVLYGAAIWDSQRDGG